jgi:DNA transposition AAA+ family ATPase
MKAIFLDTNNVQAFNAICVELESEESLVGPSLAMVTSPAGRGKTEACRHYAAQSQAVYLAPMNVRSPLMLLREITFELNTSRPGRIELCLQVIAEEMGRERRLVIIDEADLLPMPVLEMIRNLNDRYGCPILLIGEDDLKGRLASRRRLASRIRRRMQFEPIQTSDVSLFFRKSLETALSSEATSMIRRYSQGDWRPVVTLAADIERAMIASGLKTATDELVHTTIESRDHDR